MSTISRRRRHAAGRCRCRGDRYSLTMSFWVVPRSCCDGDAVLLGVGDVERRAATPPVALIVIDVFISPGGMPSSSVAHVAEVGDRHADLADLAPGHAGRRGRSRSGSAGRRRSTGRSGPWPGSSGRARWTPGPSSGPSTSASATACHAWWPVHPLQVPCPPCSHQQLTPVTLTARSATLAGWVRRRAWAR